MKTFHYEKTIFPNGTRLILIPMEGVNSVATAVMVGVGSRYETKKVNGISHFLEHMVFKGTKKYPTTDDVNVIERQGGLQNAYTDIDVTSYHNKVLAEDWELGLEINKELALNPLLEQKHVDKERDVIIEEMKRYEDEPAAKVEEKFHSMMYPGTRLGMRIIGEEESLRGVASGELKAFHDQWYKPENTVVVLAGNIKNQKSKIKNTHSASSGQANQISNIKERVEEWFGKQNQKLNIKDQKSIKSEIVKDEQIRPKVEVVTKKDAQQAHLMLGLRTFKRTSEDRFAWNVFNLLFGISFTSRLFREIREKRGLCYHIRSSSNNWADVGNWTIYAGVATEKVAETVGAIINEMKKVLDSGVTQDEVNVAKKRLKTVISFRMEDPEFFSEYYGRQEVFGEPIVTVEEYLQKIDQVDKTEIDRLVKKYFVTQNLNLALVWNKPKNEGLISRLSLD